MFDVLGRIGLHRSSGLNEVQLQTLGLVPGPRQGILYWPRANASAHYSGYEILAIGLVQFAARGEVPGIGSWNAGFGV